MSLGDIILIRTLVVNCYLVLDEPPFLVDTNSPKYLGVLEKAIADEGVGWHGRRHWWRRPFPGAASG